MSLDGGLDEFEEFFKSLATCSKRRAFSWRRAAIRGFRSATSASNSAIRRWYWCSRVGSTARSSDGVRYHSSGKPALQAQKNLRLALTRGRRHANMP
jgi:hypothetical protein